METSASEPVPDDEKGDAEALVPENKLTADNLARDSDYSRLLLSSSMTWIPLKCGIETKANGGRRVGTTQKHF